MVTTNKNIDIAGIRKLLGEVRDPEVPVLSILDLGIVRDIRVVPPGDAGPLPLERSGDDEAISHRTPERDPSALHVVSREIQTIPHQTPEEDQPAALEAPGSGHDQLEIVITPTYSGCPAMDMIRKEIMTTLNQHGYGHVKVTTVLSPAWTTEWMSQEGKDKLRAYGIAPPNPLQQVCQIRPFHREEAVQCPHCGSYHTSLISEFGSTACKALYKCGDCKEPFDYFKCH